MARRGRRGLACPRVDRRVTAFVSKLVFRLRLRFGGGRVRAGVSREVVCRRPTTSPGGTSRTCSTRRTRPGGPRRSSARSGAIWPAGRRALRDRKIDPAGLGDRADERRRRARTARRLRGREPVRRSTCWSPPSTRGCPAAATRSCTPTPTTPAASTSRSSTTPAMLTAPPEEIFFHVVMRRNATREIVQVNFQTAPAPHLGGVREPLAVAKRRPVRVGRLPRHRRGNARLLPPTGPRGPRTRHTRCWRWATSTTSRSTPRWSPTR